MVFTTVAIVDMTPTLCHRLVWPMPKTQKAEIYKALKDPHWCLSAYILMRS
jgi:hypothetical protein